MFSVNMSTLFGSTKRSVQTSFPRILEAGVSLIINAPENSPLVDAQLFGSWFCKTIVKNINPISLIHFNGEGRAKTKIKTQPLQTQRKYSSHVYLSSNHWPS